MRVTKPAMHLLLPFYKQDKKDNEKDDSREQPDKLFIEKLIPQNLYHFFPGKAKMCTSQRKDYTNRGFPTYVLRRIPFLLGYLSAFSS